MPSCAGALAATKDLACVTRGQPPCTESGPTYRTHDPSVAPKAPCVFDTGSGKRELI
jgi:hypothetical protein